MYSLLKRDSLKKKKKLLTECVSEGLKNAYKSKLLPFEQFYNFHDFHSPPMDDADFEAKPMILLVGQYSTGKTTFIRYLLEQDFPGMRIGPEPTTDSFIVVSYGEDNGIIPGNAVVVDKKKPFRALAKFGNAFLNRFMCSQVKNKVLESMTIIDTPGILAGEKQSNDRGYNFAAVIEWLAERVDRIILLFDAHKLDISDEFRMVIESMKGYDDKIRIVLNKADMVDHQELMRVYGALMWSLGKVLNTPEVARVYIGSFWDQPMLFDNNRKLFELEEQDLFQEIQNLPKNAAIRKLNDLIKRARMVKVHGLIISCLKQQMPMFLGKRSKQNYLIKHLSDIYDNIQRTYNISPGDFPQLKRMQSILKNKDFSKFKTHNKKLLDAVESMLETDVPRFMQMIPRDEQVIRDMSIIRGGAFNDYIDSPFALNCGEGVEKGKDDEDWVVNRYKVKYEEIFEKLSPVCGRISGMSARKEMMKSKLPNAILGKIWKLSDIDQDNMLDIDEFSLALYLIDLKLQNFDIPSELPPHLVPPSKQIFGRHPPSNHHNIHYNLKYQSLNNHHGSYPSGHSQNINHINGSSHNKNNYDDSHHNFYYSNNNGNNNNGNNNNGNNNNANNANNDNHHNNNNNYNNNNRNGNHHNNDKVNDHSLPNVNSDNSPHHNVHDPNSSNQNVIQPHENNGNHHNNNAHNGNPHNDNPHNGNLQNGNPHNDNPHNSNSHNGNPHNGNSHNGKPQNGNTHNGNSHNGNKHNGNLLNGIPPNGNSDNGNSHDSPSIDNPLSGNQLNGNPLNGNPLNGNPLNCNPPNGNPHNGNSNDDNPQNGNSVNGNSHDSPPNDNPLSGNPLNGNPHNGNSNDDNPQNGNSDNRNPQNGNSDNGNPHNGNPHNDNSDNDNPHNGNSDNDTSPNDNLPNDNTHKGSYLPQHIPQEMIVEKYCDKKIVENYIDKKEVVSEVGNVEGSNITVEVK